MKKDKQWLKEKIIEIPSAITEYNELWNEETEFIERKDVIFFINQLDEPEVLTQELPVIPKFVAEYLDFAKSDVPLMRVMELANTRNEWPKWKKEYDWISANDETFARAWLDGYEVAEEREQKYRVILEENSYGAMGLGIGREGRLTFTATHDKWSLPKLTEQEIKDYDERFWPFAVKVEELEE